MTDIKKKQSRKKVAKIINLVYTIRKQRVMLDQDLAILFGVETRVVNQQVKRHKDKFDNDFIFQLTKNEFSELKSSILKSQNVTSSWGGRRYPPYAFTEKGMIMLANVLRSPKASEVSKLVVRTFVEVKNILAENKSLKERIEKLEKEAKRNNQIIQTFYHVLAELNKKGKGAKS